MTRRALALVVALLAVRAPAQEPGASGPEKPPPRLSGPLYQVDVFRHVTFAEHGEEKLDFTLHRPRGPGPHPAVLVIPGGAWRMDFRWDDMAHALAAEGVAAAAMVTRKAPAADWHDQLADCRRALQFLRAHAGEMGIDAKHVGVVGFSSGGHLAALLALEGERRDPRAKDPVARRSTRPVCTVTYCAPTDLVLRSDRVLGLEDQTRLLADFLGVEEKSVVDPTGDVLATARAASPTWYASEDDPPLMVVHGDHDPIVPVSQGRLLARALERAHVKHEYVEVAGGRHVDYLERFARKMGAFKPERAHPAEKRVWDATRAFLRRNLLRGRAPRYGYHPERDAERLTAETFGVKKVRDLVYVKRGGAELKLDLYLPDAPGPHPVVLVPHGGAWKTGRRDFGDAPLFARRLASEGIAAAAPTYRFAPAHVHPAQYEDCCAAIDFLRDGAGTFDLDPTRIGALGLSAGGHLAALLAYHDEPSRPPLRAAVSYSGVLTLEHHGEKLNRLQAGIIYDFLGYDPARPETLAPAIERGKDASPVLHADERDPPLLIIHARDDMIVPWFTFESGCRQLAEVGARHEVLLMDSGNHGLYLLRMYTASRTKPPRYWATTERFLARWLLGRP